MSSPALGRWRAWISGARPRTLAAALAPVTVGTAVAAVGDGHPGGVIWSRAVLAGLVALALQVGTNYANDYSDGIRGTDEKRVGPVRLVAGGLASPKAVRAAAWACFGLAAVAGLALALMTTLWLVAVGAACIAAAWLYTGGPYPYGYAGAGELFVFVFFGLVATAGTAYVQLGRLTWLAVAAGVPVGLAASSLLAFNNLRDMPTDAATGKRTLSVRLGQSGARRLYVSCLLGSVATGAALAASGRIWALLALGALIPAVLAARKVRAGAEGKDLVPVLAMTAAAQLVLAGLLTVGLAL